MVAMVAPGSSRPTVAAPDGRRQVDRPWALAATAARRHGGGVEEPSPSRPGRLVIALAACAVAFLGAAAVVLVLQIEVGSGTAGRACGSAFDGLADRVGWEEWWAADLADPDDEVRAELLRTTQCPGAVNGRLLIAGLLGSLGALAVTALLVRRTRRHEARQPRLARLGRITAWAGVVLTLAGVAAIVLLVADADSTLFLYTDRLVVAVVGLIVLVPAVVLAVLGRALVLAADDTHETSPDSDVPERHHG
jgi:hypothetical protein